MTSLSAASGMQDRMPLGFGCCAEGQQPHAAIVCAGFGGLTVAKNRAKIPMGVTLNDRENRHLFQPPQYQVTMTGPPPLRIRRYTPALDETACLPTLTAWQSVVLKGAG
jgi:hypothetical protein